MVGRRSPGRAERIVIHVDGGGSHEYSRAEDTDGNVVWRESRAGASERAAITTAELLEALESSLQERRRAGRGRKFRL
jgi:hypothetical protein